MVRRPLLSAVLTWNLAVAIGSAPAGAQEVVRSYRATVPGVLGAAASLRTSAQRALLDEGLSVIDIAACDCLLVSGATRLDAAGRPMVVQLKVHIIRPLSVPRATVIVEAHVADGRVWPSSTAIAPSRPPAEAPPPVRALLERVIARLGRAALPVGSAADSSGHSAVFSS